MSKAITPKSVKDQLPKEAQGPVLDQTAVQDSADQAPAVNEESEKETPKKSKSWFGNQDKDKKYDLSALKIPDNQFVVRHFSTVKLANGQEMEDPTTNRFQVYDKYTFEAMSKQPVKDGKQQPSQFETLGMNVEILHKP